MKAPGQNGKPLPNKKMKAQNKKAKMTNMPKKPVIKGQK
jgi:hypothetical protein